MSRTRTAQDDECNGKCIKSADKHADKFTIHSACFEDRLTESYELGRVAELENAPAVWRERAGKAFALGGDKEAHLYRGLATEAEIRAKDARARWTEKYPR